VFSARVAQAWKGAPAEPIQLLPEYVSLPDVMTQASMNGQAPKTEGLRAPLGLDDLTLRPVWGELNADTPHFLIAGSAGSGKTALLRAWLLGLAQRYSPAELQVVLVDLRRTLRGLRGLPHMKGYAENEVRLNEVMDTLKKELTNRAQLLSSGSAPKTPLTPIVFMIDDYELVATLPKNPGTELRDVIRQARDLGLYIIIAGATTDIGKSFDPVAQQTKAVRAGVILSADPQEPPLLGVKMADLPPGRGVFVQRNSRNLMQVGFLEPEALPVWMAQIRGGGVSIKG
jgi:S-DNA-T family DNA segregation ATPase FtsK/SpoIIIE